LSGNVCGDVASMALSVGFLAKRAGGSGDAV